MKRKKKFKGEGKEKEEKQAVRLNGKLIPIEGSRVNFSSYLTLLFNEDFLPCGATQS